MPQRSFSEVYHSTYNDLWLYCLCRSTGAAQAEDILADTFTQAFAKFDLAPAGDDVRPWLFGIARNNMRNRWRKDRRRNNVHLKLVSDAARSHGIDPGPGPETLALDASNEVATAFKQLKPQDQEVLALATWEQLNHRQIALVLGCSEVSARSRLHRARKRFALELDKKNIGDSATTGHTETG